MSEKQTAPTVELFEGKLLEDNGVTYRLQSVPTGRQVWDTSAEQLVEEIYSLRSWFSHSTENIGPGPGWDSRFGLLHLSQEEMTKRYGHTFTPEEVSSPALMPDDVTYYELIPVNDAASEVAK